MFFSSFSRVNGPGRGVNHPHPQSSTKVKKRVQQYLYSLSGPPWPVLGQTFTFILFWIIRFPLSENT
jgi:hypothetical protein